jgi:uncharacterized SAM-binding protein YcdF (DUF218 family)
VILAIKTLARELILPPTSVLLLSLVGAVLAWRRWRFGWAIFFVGFGSLWLLCTPVIADWLSGFADGYPALDLSRSVDAQAVVVIGGGGQRNDAPEYNGPMAEPILLERLTLAAFIARRLSLPVAVSGAPAEAVAMSQTLSRSLGVTPRWIEANSRDTFENAQLSAKLLFAVGVKRIILVTSSAHEWRAAHEFMGAGFDVVPAPAGVLASREKGLYRYLPSASALGRSYAAVYELTGEPIRRLLAALGVREKLDRKLQPVTPAGDSQPPTASVQWSRQQERVAVGTIPGW